MGLCYMDTDNFIVYTKTEDIYIRILKDVEMRFDMILVFDCELDRLLPKRLKHWWKIN